MGFRVAARATVEAGPSLKTGIAVTLSSLETRTVMLGRSAATKQELHCCDVRQSCLICNMGFRVATRANC